MEFFFKPDKAEVFFKPDKAEVLFKFNTAKILDMEISDDLRRHTSF